MKIDWGKNCVVLEKDKTILESEQQSRQTDEETLKAGKEANKWKIIS